MASNDPHPTPEPDNRAFGWQHALRDAVRDVDELARLLDLPPDTPGFAAASAFPLLVPRGFVARMKKGDPYDPLLRQILPTTDEADAAPGFSADPIAERALARHGAITKYPGRALLITTAACPVHCRYCFRREFPYAEQSALRDDFEAALAALSAQPGIREIILSGGDPLSLSNSRLERLIRAIEALPAVTSLRIHTRFPIVLPERIDDGLVALLGSTPLDTVVVVHANHPAEIDAAVRQSAARLRPVTSALLNQSVLLRGINDRTEVLIALSERLRGAGIMPYYLHLLDRVTGAGHFEVDERTAIELVESMRKHVPGYLVPRLVRDVPGELSKTPVA